MGGVRLAGLILPFVMVSSLSSIGLATETDEARSHYRNWQMAIEGQAAPGGGPLGIAGIAVDVLPIPELSLAAGVGAGGSSTQWAATVRPRFFVSRDFAVVAGVGYSRGDYRSFVPFSPDQEFRYRDCSWANAEIGIEWRFTSHVVVRPFMGVSQLFDSKYPEGSESFSRPRWPRLAYFGLALGVFFSL